MDDQCIKIGQHLIDAEQVAYAYPDKAKAKGNGSSLSSEGIFEHKPELLIVMKDGKEFRFPALDDEKLNDLVEKIRVAKLPLPKSSESVPEERSNFSIHNPPLDANSPDHPMSPADAVDLVKALKQIAGHLENLGQQTQRIVLEIEQGGIPFRLVKE